VRQLARWGILIGAFIIAAVVYGVWKQIDKEMGGGFISGFFRGAIVLGFLVWVWNATKKRGEKDE
jgi:Na+-transporting NADH:ubiquinone oxidoreductase subunit NqrD